MKLKAVAMYSEVDAKSLHVQLADEAYCIGPVRGYMDMEKIIEIAKYAKVDGIHPGYGFLSENSNFAEMCAENNIAFVGPTASSMRTVGDKINARKTMKAHGVPVVPGSDGGVESEEEVIAIADEIGYPVVIKATAGGGGRGGSNIAGILSFVGIFDRSQSRFPKPIRTLMDWALTITLAAVAVLAFQAEVAKP